MYSVNTQLEAATAQALYDQVQAVIRIFLTQMALQSTLEAMSPSQLEVCWLQTSSTGTQTSPTGPQSHVPCRGLLTAQLNLTSKSETASSTNLVSKCTSLLLLYQFKHRVRVSRKPTSLSIQRVLFSQLDLPLPSRLFCFEEIFKSIKKSSLN